MNKPKFPNKRLVLVASVILCLGLIAGALVTQALTPSQTFYISSGIYPGAPSYTVWVEGTSYFAKDSLGHTVYSGTNVTDIIASILPTSKTILFSPGTYLIDAVYGIQFTASDIAVYGYGAIIKNDYVGSQLELFYVSGSNVSIYGLTFDQDSGDPTHTYNGAGGTQWVFKTGHVSNCLFQDIKILNGIGCGYVSGDSRNIKFINAYINNVGEHPIYTADGDQNIVFSHSTIMNWAENIRGYVKISFSTNVQFYDTVFDIAQDGHTPSELGGGGSYTFDIGSSNQTLFSNCLFIDPIVSWIEGNSSNTQIIGGNFTRKTAYANPMILDSANATIISGVTFYKLTYIAVDAHLASDTIVQNCYFSGGVTGGAIYWGTRTRVMGNTWGDDTTTGDYGMAAITGTGIFFGNDVNNSTLTFDFPADIQLNGKPYNIYH